MSHTRRIRFLLRIPNQLMITWFGLASLQYSVPNPVLNGHVESEGARPIYRAKVRLLTASRDISFKIGLFEREYEAPSWESGFLISPAASRPLRVHDLSSRISPRRGKCEATDSTIVVDWVSRSMSHS